MDKVTKDKWIEELRSGKHRQTRQELENCNGKCCLGVFLNTIDYPKRKINYDEKRNTYSYIFEGKTATLPKDVVEKYNIPGDEFIIIFKDQYECFKFKAIAFNHRVYDTIGNVTFITYFQQGMNIKLTNLNDDGWSFEAIADVIEAFVEVDGE